MFKTRMFGISYFEHSNLFRISIFGFRILFSQIFELLKIFGSNQSGEGVEGERKGLGEESLGEGWALGNDLGPSPKIGFGVGLTREVFFVPDLKQIAAASKVSALTLSEEKFSVAFLIPK